ncbi:MAG: MogA/MoaB family molybdenum cofactor biosynthesis protein [Thaumarchaeota archaeon]|nr:MogA/MoaB family molybdenum cofactor biosynthesis protein [Nitrososphaerota archaeon]
MANREGKIRVMAHEEHRKRAPQKLKISLLTVSTSKFFQKAEKGDKVIDESGDIAERMIKRAGHERISRKLLNDDVWSIRLELLKAIFEEKADVVLIMGGTGVSERDVTIEAVKPLITKEIEGFGEIFRSITYRKIGSPAILTRAIGGTLDKGKLVFCLPGSPDGVRTALSLLLPELPHTFFISSS